MSIIVFLKVLFWLGVFIIFYSYIGYGILLGIMVKLKRKSAPATLPDDPGQWPALSVVIAAFNEEDFIKDKIENTLSLDYPKDKLEIIFITDGSSDKTPELASSFTGIQVLHQPERRGKIAAIHRAMSFVNHPIVVFSDANTLLNADSLKNIARHYSSPKVGGVAGEKKIRIEGDGSAAGAGEGIYWKYESLLKKLDSELYTVVGAAGELFSIRTELYEYVGDNILLDDFIISLRICRRGYRIAYEPDAFALESPSASIAEEQKRKIRISAGAFQSMVLLRDLLNIFRFGMLSFQYISHRVLRWTLCPLFLPIIFISNVLICLQQPGNTFYLAILAAQVFFYLAALAGWWLSLQKAKVKVFYVPYYFAFLNFSLYRGLARYLKGSQTVLWDKAKRGQYSKAGS